ncbi:MAG TPA: VOC family protein [Ilumatobacter sp.]|nr:VOC family protein [Ilumatobacter sp.]
MSVQLNHTVVGCRDSAASAAWLTDLFDLPPPVEFGPFHVVEVANGVSLDFGGGEGEIHPQHYAFLVTEAEFTSIYAKIVARNMEHWADPRQHRPGTINHHDGGRGVYFLSNDGHYLEIITRPYG